MIYIKINDVLYPATISGRMSDVDWNDRESKSIRLEMDYDTAVAVFVDGLEWSIVQQEEVPVYDENGKQTGVEVEETEWDNSDYFIAGSITDHRDGTISAKMGKITDAEALAEIMEVLA